MTKPVWFEANKKEKEAKDAIEEVREWLYRRGIDHGVGGKWSRVEVACEVGKALEQLVQSRGQAGMTGGIADS